MMSTEIINLRTDLLLCALNHLDAKWDAEQAGQREEAKYHDRHYQQALTGFNSLGGGE